MREGSAEGALHERMQNVAHNSRKNAGNWSKVIDAVTVTRISFDGEGADRCAQIVVDNASSWKTKLRDLESREEIKFLFAVVTTKDEDGDRLLAHMCKMVDLAGLHHHT
jgi:hypothetical protein